MTACGKNGDNSAASDNSDEAAITSKAAEAVSTVTPGIVTTTAAVQTTETLETSKETENYQQTEEKNRNTVQGSEFPTQTQNTIKPQIQPAVTNPESETEAQITTTVKTEAGLSKSDRDEINRYIKETAKSYGIGTACADCNNEGAVILTGYVDPWNNYSFNSPVSTAINNDVSSVKSYVDSEIVRIRREWIREDGASDEELTQYYYLNVYWEKDADNYWLYLMW